MKINPQHVVSLTYDLYVDQEDGSEVLQESATEEQQIKNQRGNAALDGNLQIGHVHVVPDAGVDLKVLRPQTQDRVMFNPFERPPHQELAGLIGLVGNRTHLGIGTSSDRRQARHQRTAGHRQQQHGRQSRGPNQVEPAALHSEVPQAHRPRNHQADESGSGRRHHERESHDQDCSGPAQLDDRSLGG